MPSRPHSEHEESTRAPRSRKTEEAATAGLFSNTFTAPKRSTTNQRLELPGACHICSGFRVTRVTGSRNERLGNARSVPIVALPVERGGAMQVVLLGRASSPDVWAGGSEVGGTGG